MALIQFIHILFETFNILIFIRIIFSWIPVQNEFSEFVYTFTEPILKPFKLVIPLGGMGGLDLSPMIAIIALQFLEKIIIGIVINIL